MDRRVTFDRAVWTKPLAFAADAAPQLCRFNREDPGRAERALTAATCRVATATRRPASATARCVGAVTATVGYTSGARAYERDTSDAWRAAGAAYERVMEDVGEERVEKELPRASAVRRCAWEPRSGDTATTLVAVPATGGSAGGVGGDGQGLTTLGELAGATARGEEAEVADADEALREDVQEEAAEKFLGVERERAHLAAVAIVLPPKRDGVVGHVDEPVVRDGDAVGVAREVVEHVGTGCRRAAWRTRPTSGDRAIAGRRERRRQSSSGASAPGKVEAAVAITRLADRRRACRERPCRRTGIGRKKRGRAWIHRVPSGASPPVGHDAVDVGMMLEPLAPRVEHHQPADRGAQALRIRGDLQQRRRGRAKQQVVHDALVGEREARQRLRHREDDVDVADGQELLLAGRHPRVPRGGQTLGAVPIAAAVVREGRVRALLTAIAMPAERRGAALRDGPEHAPMLPGDPRAVGLQEAIAMLAHDVGHLEGWPRHRWCFSRVRRAVSGPEMVSASRGFATACRCFCERWRYSTVCRIFHVAEEQLNRAEVRATFEEVRRIGMAQAGAASSACGTRRAAPRRPHASQSTFG